MNPKNNIIIAVIILVLLMNGCVSKNPKNISSEEAEINITIDSLEVALATHKIVQNNDELHHIGSLDLFRRNFEDGLLPTEYIYIYKNDTLEDVYKLVGEEDKIICYSKLIVEGEQSDIVEREVFDSITYENETIDEKTYEHVVLKNENSSKIIFTTILSDIKKDTPILYLSYDNQEYIAVQGTASWYYYEGKGMSSGFESDSGAPDKLVEYQTYKLVIGEDKSITLKFDYEPTSVGVKIWNKDGSFLADYDSDLKRVTVPEQPESIIYEIHAYFDNGDVYYAFEVWNSSGSD